MRLLERLKKLVDPVGPLGEILSPADVYKTRAGLPITSPHAMRVAMAAPADVERALAPVRFVSLEDAVDVPRDRVRQVSAFVEEVFEPVYRKTDSTDLATILRTSQELVGWSVRQRASVSSQARHRLSAEQFVEVAQSAQIQASDAFYNGLLETVPGNDPFMVDGKMLKGTIITKGRTEYNQRTKGFVHWDQGFVKERAKAQAEMESRPQRNVKAALERKAGEVLPMRRILANPRRDRMSQV
jgi:hypothetical protein